MARPTTTQRGGPAFGVEQRGAQVGLQVNAPLAVNARDGRAEALARMVGMLAQPAMQYAAQKSAEQQKSDAEAGATDAAMGNAPAYVAGGPSDSGGWDENLDKVKKFFTGENRRAKTYTEAYEKTQAIKIFNEAAVGFQEWVNTEGAYLPPDEFAAQLDERMKEAIGTDVLSNPKQAYEIARRYTPLMAQLTDAHGKRLLAEQQATTLDALGADATARLMNGEEVDWQEYVQSMAGVGIARSDAVKHFVGTAAQAAVEAAQSGDAGTAAARAEAILAQLEADGVDANGGHLPGPAKSAAHRETVDRARADVARVVKDRLATQTALHKFDVEARYVRTIEAGRRISFSELQSQLKQGVITESEAVSWYQKGLAAENAAAKKVDTLATIANSGLPLWSLQGHLTSSETDEVLMSRVDRLTGGDPDKMLQAAVMVYEKDGFADPRVVGALNNVPWTDPKAAGKLADMYRTLRPELRGKFVTDDTRRADYDRYLRMIEAGVTPEAAAKDIADTDTRQTEANWEQGRREVGKGLQSNYTVGAAPGRFWGTNPVKVEDLANPGPARAFMERQVRLRVERGATPEAALEDASRDLAATHMVTKSATGGYYLIPRLPNAPADYGNMMVWAEENLNRWIPDAPPGSHFSVTYDNKLAPVDSSGLPVSARRVDPQRMFAEWLKMTDKERHAALQEANGRFKARQAELDAALEKTREFGITPFSSPIK